MQGLSGGGEETLIEEIKKAGLECPKCGFELLVTKDVVFCQNRACEGYFRRVMIK